MASPQTQADHDQERDQEQQRQPGVGALLRASRLRCGEELRDIAELLCIRYLYLEAIEAGRYQDLPGTTYAIGFIRAYAEHLGLDSEEVVRRFKAEQSTLKQQSELAFPTPVPESGIPKGAIVFVGLIIAGLAYGGWYLSSSENGGLAGLIGPLPDRLQALVEGGNKPADTTMPADGASTPDAMTTTAPAEPAGGSTMSTESGMSAETTTPSAETATTGTDTGTASETTAPASTTSTETATTSDTSASTSSEATAASGTSSSDTSTASQPEATPAPAPEAPAAPASETTTAAPSNEPAATASSDTASQPEAPAASTETAAPAPAAPADTQTRTASESPAPAANSSTESTTTPSSEQSAASTASTASETPPAPAASDSAPATTSTTETTASAPSASEAATTAEPAPAEPAATETAQGTDATPPAPPTEQAATPADKPATETASTAPAATSAGIVIKAVDNSWVQIRDTNSNETVVTRLLRAGEQITVDAKPGLMLSTGNAGGLEIIVDGTTVPSIGGPGTVRRNVSLDPDRLKAGTALQ